MSVGWYSIHISVTGSENWAQALLDYVLALESDCQPHKRKGEFLVHYRGRWAGRFAPARISSHIRTLLTFRKTFGPQKGDVIEELKLWTPSSFVLFLWTGNVMEFMMQWAGGAGGNYSVLRREICCEIPRKRPKGDKD